LVVEISNREEAYNQMIGQCGLRYIRVEQEKEHTPVDPYIVVNSIFGPNEFVKLT
jgi:hypothetical protein